MTNAVVTPLKVVPRESEFQAALVARLEWLLEEAKAGRLVTVFYLSVSDDGGWAPTWAGAPQSRLFTIGQLEAIKWEILNYAEKNSS